MADFNIEKIKHQDIDIKPASVPTSGTPNETDISIMPASSSGSGIDSEVISDEIKEEIDKAAKEIQVRRAQNNEQEVSNLKKLKRESQQIDKNPNIKNYTHILISKEKAENKAFKLIDTYLSKNDSNYQSLKTNDEQRAYANKKLQDVLVSLSGNKTEIKNHLQDIATLCIISETQNKSLDSFLSMDRNELLGVINKEQEKQLAILIEESDVFNKSKTPEENIKNLLNIVMSYSDPDYEKLKGNKKEEYLHDKFDKMVESIAGKGWKTLDKTSQNRFLQIILDSNKSILKQKGLAGLKEIQSMSESEKAETILKYISNDAELIEGNPRLRDLIEISKKRIEIVRKIENETGRSATELDYYNKLKELHDKGELPKRLESEYKAYSMMLTHGTLKKEEPVNIIGNAIKAAVHDQRKVEADSYKEYFTTELGIDNKKISREELYSEEFIDQYKKLYNQAKADQSRGFLQMKVLDRVLMEHGLSKKEIIEFKKMHGFDNNTTFAAHAMVEENVELTSEISNYTGTNGSSQSVNEMRSILTDAAEIFNKQDFENLWIKNEHEVFDTSYATGMNRVYSAEQSVKILSDISKIASAERTSSITKASVVTADAQRQLYYGKELSKLDNLAVTKGLAAAEKYVDSSVKSQYSAEVTSSVNRMQSSGKCTQADVDSINKTRQTGYTESETKKVIQTQNTVSNSVSAKQAKLEAERKNEYQALVAKKQAVLNYAAQVLAQTIKPVVKSDKTIKIDEEIEKLKNAKSPQEIESAINNIKDIIEQHQLETISNEKIEAEKNEITEQEAVDAFVAELEDVNQDNENNKYNLSAETIIEIQSAYSQGGLVGLFDKIVELSGVVGSDAQQKLLNYIAHTDSSTLHSFASAHSGDKAILMTLYNNSKDPEILRLLLRLGIGNNLIGHNGITIKDFLGHADKDLIANWIKDLATTGSVTTLNSALEMLDDSQAAAVKAKTGITKDTKGGDEWLQAYNTQAVDNNNDDNDGGLPIGSNKLPMRGDYNRMKKKGPFYYSA